MRKLMWLTIGFGAACAWGAYLGNDFAFVIMRVSLLLTVALGAVGKKWKFLRIASVICAGVVVGMSWFGLYDHCWLKKPKTMDEQILASTIRLTNDAWETDYGYGVDGTIELDGKEYNVRLYLNKTEESLSVAPGDYVSGEFLFRLTKNREQDHFRGEGIFLLAYQRGDIAVETGSVQNLGDMIAVFRSRIKECIEAAFGEDTEAFAKALLLGDTSSLSYEADTWLKVSGIRHIVAVSGLHVSILFSLVYMISGKRRLITALIGVPVLLFFAAVAGFTPSITRACLMQILIIGAMLFDREYDPPTALAFAAVIILVLNPLSITSVGFQLSVGCMIGILLFAGRIRGWMLSDKCLGEAKGKGIKAKVKRWFAGSVSVSLGAMVVTTPLCAWYFGMVSLVGVLTNLLTLWVVTFLFCGIGAVVFLSLFWVAGAKAVTWVTSWGIRYVLAAARLLAGFPLAAVYTSSVYVVIWLAFCYVLIALFLILRKKHPAVFGACMVIGLCVALMLSWVEPLMDECRVTVLDVGQGQCILLQSRGKTYLVDCGGRGEKITADVAAQELLSQGISRLDGLIISHYDGDHCAGAANLLTRVDADVIFAPAVDDSTGVAERIESVTDGRVIYVAETLELSYADVRVTVVPSAMLNSDNESGLCVLFQTEKCAILITGDRDGFGERMLMRAIQIPELDVLVVGHHGAKTSACEELLAATMPEYAFISVGENNSYDHPAQETLDRLQKFGCIIFRTDLHGKIIFRR